MGYKVKKGETLSKIAKDNGLTLEQLKKLNPNIKDINNIQIGQEINLSDKSNEQMRSYYAQQNAKLGLKPKQHVIYETPNQKIGLGQYIVPEYINNEPVQDKTFTNYNQNQTPIFNSLLPDFNNLSKDEIMNIQSQLKSMGYDLGNSGKNKDGVDGDWGNKSKIALQMALNDGYSFNNNQLIGESNSSKLFEEGSNQIIGNAVTTTKHLLDLITGKESESNYASNGTKKQALALALKYRPVDADERLKNGESVTWSIGEDSNGDYLWKYINGGHQVHEKSDKNRSLYNRVAYNSGEHTLGQYSITEHPDGSFTINDDYNHNNSGTKFSNNIQNPTPYDKVRSFVGNNFGESSHGYPINWEISSKQANRWRNL